MGNPTDSRTGEAVAWIEEVLGTKLDADFQQALKSGVVLCELINKLRPGAIGKINRQKVPFCQMENIENYLEASLKLGVPAHESFMTVDLFDGKNLNQVVQSLISLKRVLGFGFKKQNQTEKPQKEIAMSDDQSTDSDKIAAKCELKETPQVLSGVTIAGKQAMLAGHGKVDASKLAVDCPVCCLSIIGASINACGRQWHPRCFKCKQCGVELGLKQYFEESGKPMCDRCMNALVSKSSGAVKVKTCDMGFSFE